MSRQRSGRSTNQKTVKVYYGLIELTITGNYNEGDKGDMWTPGTGAELHIETIEYNGNDIHEALYEILSSKTYDELVNKAIEQIESEL